MKLYDSKFVHFEWNDVLDGKCCFVADNINTLISRVNTNDNTNHFLKVSKGNESYPFECGEETSGNYRFAYYDPNYDVKYAYWEMGYDIYTTLKGSGVDWMKIENDETFFNVIDDPDYEFKIDDGFAELREAYKQGKTIQHMNLDGDWVDCDMPVSFDANHSYRIKPEEKKFSQDELDELDYKLTVQTEFHKGNTIYYRNKTFNDSDWHPFSKMTAGDYHFDFDTYEYKYKVDSEEIINKGTTLDISDKGFGELDKEYIEKIKHWFNNGETIAYRPFNDTMWNLISKYTNGEDYAFDFSKYEYRVVSDLLGDTIAISRKDLKKDNDISHKLRDTIQKSLSNPDLYRPFKDTNELIEYWDKHYVNGNRPNYTMPLIWIKGKETGNVCLITRYGYLEDDCVCLGDDWWVSMKELFGGFVFLDGRCCGKVKE